MPSYVPFGRSFRRHCFRPLLPLHSRIRLTTELCTSSLRGQRWRSTRPPHPPALPLPPPSLPQHSSWTHVWPHASVPRRGQTFYRGSGCGLSCLHPCYMAAAPESRPSPPHPLPSPSPTPPPFCDDSDHYIHLICAQRHAFIPMPRLPAARAPPSPSRRRHHAPAPTRFDRTSQ